MLTDKSLKTLSTLGVVELDKMLSANPIMVEILRLQLIESSEGSKEDEVLFWAIIFLKNLNLYPLNEDAEVLEQQLDDVLAGLDHVIHFVKGLMNKLIDDQDADEIGSEYEILENDPDREVIEELKTLAELVEGYHDRGYSNIPGDIISTYLNSLIDSGKTIVVYSSTKGYLNIREMVEAMGEAEAPVFQFDSQLAIKQGNNVTPVSFMAFKETINSQISYEESNAIMKIIKGHLTVLENTLALK